MSLKFKREMDFEYGVAERLSPLVRRVMANNPSPYTYTGTGTYIVGEGTVAVIDPGPRDHAHLDALKMALANETVSHILITHTHADHSPLAADLKDLSGAKTYAYGPHGAGRENRQAKKGSGDIRLDASGDMGFTPDETLQHGDVIAGTGWTMECVFTPGHTSNHMAFALNEEETLFSGDHVMAWATSVIIPPDGNMADYMASLRLLLERDEKIYLPTHGPAVTKPKPYVRGFINHRKAREAAIVERIRGGTRTIAEIVPDLYAAVDPALHPAAAMSVLAHLHDLVERGVIETDGEPGHRSEYRIKP